MLMLTANDKVNFEAFEQNIGAEHSTVYVDTEKYYEILDDINAEMEAMRVNVGDTMDMLTNHKLKTPTPPKMIKTLTEFCGVDHLDISYRGKLSANMKLLREYRRRVLADRPNNLGYLQGKAMNLIEDYCNYREIHSAEASAQAKCKQMKFMDGSGWRDLDLAAIDFMYQQRATGRYYTADDNIQGWNSAFLSTITVPKGYFLWWGDLAQIDLRVFLNAILSRNDPALRRRLSKYADKYEAFVRLMYEALDRPFDYAEFRSRRDIYKTGVLACLYGISENSLVVSLQGDRQLAKMFIAFLEKNEAYKSYLDNITDTIKFGGSVTMQDYFGVKRTVEVLGHHANPHNVNQCINMPIQCGSNSIVIHWTNHVMNRFRELGYGPEDIYVYLIRHDEILIAFKQKVMEDMWILDDCSKIQVDDWDLLEIESSLGLYYTEPQDTLMELYRKTCERHAHLYHTGTDGQSYNYQPLKPVLKAYMYSSYTPFVFLEKVCGEKPPEEVSQAIQRIKEIAQQGKGTVASSCRSFLAFANQISYFHPYEKVWKYRRPSKEILEIDCDNIAIHTCVGSGNEYVQGKIIRYIVWNSDEVLPALLEGKPLWGMYNDEVSYPTHTGRKSFRSNDYDPTLDIIMDEDEE